LDLEVDDGAIGQSAKPAETQRLAECARWRERVRPACTAEVGVDERRAVPVEIDDLEQLACRAAPLLARRERRRWRR
jgi:hypothetical protein